MVPCLCAFGKLKTGKERCTVQTKYKEINYTAPRLIKYHCILSEVFSHFFIVATPTHAHLPAPRGVAAGPAFMLTD